MNKLKIIVPFYNAERFLTQCQESLLAQTFTNWQAYLSDDDSIDSSESKVIEHPNIFYYKNSVRKTALLNIHDTIMSSNAEDDDIICILDGDDFLFRRNSLEIIDSLYNDNTLLTYGQYIWPNGMIGHSRAYTTETFAMLRKGGYWASHMRTFKFKLYKELVRQDPNLDCYRDNTGAFFETCADVATMTPLMEIAGLENIKFNPEPIYYYRTHELNDVQVDAIKQKNDEITIFAKSPFRATF